MPPELQLKLNLLSETLFALGRWPVENGELGGVEIFLLRGNNQNNF